MRTWRRRLPGWYRRNQRRLPWRAVGGHKPNPYHVLVSETMLQQTQVVTVIDYFERFIKRLATLTDLAEAQEKVVLRLWQGLGYYRRARHLHAAARMIVTDYDGKVPDTVERLLRLPGVGRYTAAAVASIVYGRHEAVLDANVKRVLARGFGVDEPIDDRLVTDRLWRMAQSLLPQRRSGGPGGPGRPGGPGDFNQAMMELGALVCLPRVPQCDRCPVADVCHANTQGRTGELPVRRIRRPVREVVHHIVAVCRGGKWLFAQRPADGLWSNMWQMPAHEQLDANPDGRELTRWIKQQFGVHVSVPAKAQSFEHQTTHRRIRFVLWHTQAIKGRLGRGAGIWRKLDAIDDLPLSNPQRRVVQMVREQEQVGL